MRKWLLLLALAALPAAAQNTDIESLSGLQFNFGNPGARSLGMGGAFLGLADDASAAEANPAGLTILRKPEISIEARNYLEQQVLTTSGTFPNVNRTPFTHYSDRVVISFASVVYPIKNFTIGAYYHEPLKNGGAGQVVPQRNEFTGAVETDVPNFFLPKNGQAPVTATECNNIRRQANDPFACLEYTVNPFLTAVDVRQRTFGLAGAWKFGKLSLGANARYQTFSESSFTFRVTPTFAFDSISVQATADVKNGALVMKDQNDLTFGAGFKFEATDKISVGGVFKQGPKFVAPTFIATASNNLEFEKLADTTFHIPDIYGLGVSVRPIPTLTINGDAVHVKYSNLTDDFVSTVADVRDIENPYEAKDVTELRLGTEYFFSTKIPFALRAGFWRDPAHSIEWRGPLNAPDAVAAALLYPKGEAQNHWSVGAGLAWPRFQVDFAYDSSKFYKVGSLSMVTRF
ncbi:MAG: outer membrane protein transport protein [Acidobacteria bacterium]|nr:outer membrane protein transport protein [Acidobacteriota bacterium]